MHGARGGAPKGKATGTRRELKLKGDNKEAPTAVPRYQLDLEFEGEAQRDRDSIDLERDRDAREQAVENAEGPHRGDVPDGGEWRLEPVAPIEY